MGLTIRATGAATANPGPLVELTPNAPTESAAAPDLQTLRGSLPPLVPRGAQTVLGPSLREPTASLNTTTGLHDVIRKAMGSAIIINAVDPGPEGTFATGAGTVVEPGFALTSHHVVENAETIYYASVDASGGQVLHKAKVVGSAPNLDITLLELDDKTQPAATFAETAPRHGDFVLAVGAPVNQIWSTAIGYVTGLHRDLGGNPVCDCIQTDAGINVGDSGGGAYDKDGQLMGMVDALFDDKHGMAFIIPAATLEAVVERLHKGDLDPTPFGLTLVPANMLWAAAHDTRSLDGAVIAGVYGRASGTTLKPDDRIVAIDGTRVVGTADANTMLELIPEGQRFKLVVERAGQTVVVQATR